MTPTSSEPRRIGARFSLRSALVATAVCAAIFAGIRQYIFITTPRVAILCEKPGAKLYLRDQFQGMVPVTYTESRARLLVPDYDQIVRKWHRGFPSKECERDLRSILTDQVASGGRGFWLLHEADDEHSYHYRETPWGLALGLTSVGGDRRGLHMDLHRRSAESIAFVESWKLSDKPVLPETRCQASVLLGATASADSIGKQWRVQIHYDSFEPIDYAATQPDVSASPTLKPWSFRIPTPALISSGLTRRRSRDSTPFLYGYMRFQVMRETTTLRLTTR